MCIYGRLSHEESVAQPTQSINMLSNQANKEGLIKLLFENVKKLTKTNTVFYYNMTHQTYEMMIEGNHFIGRTIEDKLKSLAKLVLNSNKPMEVNILDKRFIMNDEG